VPGGSAGTLTATTSQLVSAWAEHADTSAARQAGQLPAGMPDWPTQVAAADRPVFSDLVLLLFASDLATAGASLPVLPSESASPAGRTEQSADHPDARTAVFAPAEAAPAAADVGAACQAVVGFTANVRAAITNAINRLTLNPPPVDTGFGLFDTVVNAIVAGAAGVANVSVQGLRILVDGVFAATVDQVLGFVAKIAGVVGTLATIANLVKPWVVTLDEKDPAMNQVAVRPAELGPAGTITARVVVPFDTWPAGIEQCATSVGRPLPSLKPVGNAVTWNLQGFDSSALLALAVMDPDGTDSRLREDSTARLGYHAGVEDPPEEGADLKPGIVVVSVRIQRDDVTKLETLFHNLVTDALTGALPLGDVPFARNLVAQVAKPLLDEITNGVTRALAEIRTQDQTGFVVVQYHGPGDDSTPRPGSGPTSPEGKRGRVPTRCPHPEVFAQAAPAGQNMGPWEFIGRTISEQFDKTHHVRSCAYSRWVSQEFNNPFPTRLVEQYGLILFQRPTPPMRGDQPVQLTGTDRAWFGGGALYVEVDGRTLGIIPFPGRGNVRAKELAIANAVLGLG